MILSQQNLYQQSHEQRQAVQSLLQIQNHQEGDDWKNNGQLGKQSKKQRFKGNIKALNVKSNYVLSDNQNQNSSQNFVNANKFKRAKSLFDPLKAFKIGLQQFIYKQPLTPEPNLNFIHRRVIHRHPQKIRDLNFKTGRPTRNSQYKKDALQIQQTKNNSIQFLNGQSVIIQVQSYQESFNRKEIQYLMSKTLGSKEFKSQLNKKNNAQTYSLLQIKNQDINIDSQTQLSQLKNGQKSKPRMRITSYGSNNKIRNQKSPTKNKNRNSANELSYSLDFKSSSVQQGTQASLRQLLNNYKAKYNGYINRSSNSSKLQNIRKILPVNDQIDKNNDKIFDKQIILKSFEQQQILKLQKNRISKKAQIQLHQKQPNSSMTNSVDTKIYSSSKQKNKHEMDLATKLARSNKKDYSAYMKTNLTQKLNQPLKVSSPHKYYQKNKKRQYEQNNKKVIQQQHLKLFNVKKIG